MNVSFPDKRRVHAAYKDFIIETDQPDYGGGDNSAPAPFALFIASIATCAGFYMLDFMQHRDIPTEGSGITLRTEKDQDAGLICTISLELILPAGFPEKYRAAIVNAVELCPVKRHLVTPPAFQISTVMPNEVVEQSVT